jgi:DNA adenine methylase
MQPDTFSRIAHIWSIKIRNVRFKCADYRLTLGDAEKGDFVYLDPPYAGNKQRYIEDVNSEDFFTCLHKLNSKGVKYGLSFDGYREGIDFTKPIPEELYKRRILINSGYSPVKKVLNGQKQNVRESLYLNY